MSETPKKQPMPPKGTPELYSKACELCESAYKVGGWRKKQYEKKIGYMLIHIFGKGHWTLKDLDDEKLNIVINLAIAKINKRK